MANRSYLYSSDVDPGYNKTDKKELIGISEWDYDIPFVYKLLLTGETRMCKSSIWDVSNDIALVGDYLQGVERLKGFFRRIDFPSAQPLLHEATNFLEKKENRRNFFVLECGEIFDMSSQPIHEQNLRLLEEIKNIDADVEKVLSGLNSLKKSEPKELFANLFGGRACKSDIKNDAIDSIYALGLGNWTNVLYYDLFNE